LALLLLLLFYCYFSCCCCGYCYFIPVPVVVVVVYSLVFNVIVAVVFDSVVKNNLQYFELSNPI